MATYNVIDFGKKYKITSSNKISANTIDKYKEVAPPALIHLWETHGLPVINDGLITFINPDDYFPTLDLWLGKHAPNYIPMAIGAFGNFFYYRKLKEDVDDVCQIEPHYRKIETCSWSYQEFFETYLYDDYTKDYVLREKEFKAALKKNGPLTKHEMYMFVPALVLGGEESGKSTEKGDARVHLDFLFQATQ